ncbi:phthiocerol/phthiodiolone dimycocerosyl transferase family protein [Nocardia thraciensis]
MATQRPQSPFESGYFRADARFGSVPVGGMPLYIGSTVEGDIDAEALRAVLADLAARHPLLACLPVDDAGVPLLRHRSGYRPPLVVAEGDEIEYVRLANEPPDWGEGLFRAVLLRDGEQSRVVLVIHHGIVDGRSAFALLDEMWRRYTARLRGAPLPVAAAEELPQAVDDRLAATISGPEVEELLDRMRAMMAEAPAQLPRVASAAGVRGFLAAERIELSASETTAFVAAARSAGITVNSLLSGCAMVAVRGRFDAAGPLPMVCGYAADLRSTLDPRLSDDTLLNCASGWGTALSVAAADGPVELGRIVDADVRAALDRRDPARLMVAGRHIRDEQSAAMLSSQPTFALSNIGRVPTHEVPPGVKLLRDNIFAMNPGMPPKATAFTLGGRLTVQVEYDTADHSRTQMGEVRRALSQSLHHVAADTARSEFAGSAG